MVNNMALVTKLFQLAIDGNLQAFDRLQQLVGEAPSTKITIDDTRQNNPFKDMTTEELRGMLNDNGHTEEQT